MKLIRAMWEFIAYDGGLLLVYMLVVVAMIVSC